MTEIGTPQLQELKAIKADLATCMVRLELVIKEAESEQFLGELNEKDGEYQVSMLVQAAEETPQIPSDEELGKAIEKPEVKELEKRFDLEQTGEALPPKNIIDILFEQQNKDEWVTVESGSATFHNFCAWLINGEKDTGLPVTDARLFTVQETKKCKFTRKDFDHLQNIMWWRSELKKGKEGGFSLKSILDQNSTTEAEKPLWEALAKTLK